jgi:hypothetical protein
MKKLNNTQKSLNGSYRRTICLFPQFFVFTLLFAASSVWAAKSDKKNVSTIGSGAQYTTTVERETEGELSNEDFSQVSTLGSHIVGHLNDATESLEDNALGKAKNELEKAATLVKVIRDMLPTTTVKKQLKPLSRMLREKRYIAQRKSCRMTSCRFMKR